LIGRVVKILQRRVESVIVADSSRRSARGVHPAAQLTRISTGASLRVLDG